METKLKWSGCFQSTEVQQNPKYLTLSSVSPLNNPQNSEMKICENMTILKIIIIIIIIGYIKNNFTTHITNIMVDDGKYI
jgi:hypothetical protein